MGEYPVVTVTPAEQVAAIEWLEVTSPDWQMWPDSMVGAAALVHAVLSRRITALEAAINDAVKAIDHADTASTLPWLSVLHARDVLRMSVAAPGTMCPEEQHWRDKLPGELPCQRCGGTGVIALPEGGS